MDNSVGLTMEVGRGLGGVGQLGGTKGEKLGQL